MNSEYCGPCRHIDHRAHSCTLFKKKLAYSTTSICGSVRTTVFEKCRECKDFDNAGKDSRYAAD